MECLSSVVPLLGRNVCVCMFILNGCISPRESERERDREIGKADRESNCCFLCSNCSELTSQTPVRTTTTTTTTRSTITITTIYM